MAGVTEVDDLAVVEEVVFARRDDTAGGCPETGVAGGSIEVLIQNATTNVGEPPCVTMIWCAQGRCRISPMPAQDAPPDPRATTPRRPIALRLP